MARIAYTAALVSRKSSRVPRTGTSPASLLPNKALQLPGYRSFQSTWGIFWHGTSSASLYRGGGPAAERPIRKAARMATFEDANERFYAGARGDQLRFVINDSVRGTSGPHSGRTEAVISIVVLEPEPIFVVEPAAPPYGGLKVARSKLELIE